MLDSYLEEMMEQSNIKHAIIGEMNMSLKEILGGLTKTRLSALARAYQVPGRSKMKQGELAAALLDVMTRPEVMEAYLQLLDKEEYEMFGELNQAPFIQNNYVIYGHYAYLLELGLVFSYFQEGKVYLVMPEEIKETYGRLSAGGVFLEEQKWRRLIMDYVEAASNLYGICTLDKLAEIINAHQGTGFIARDELEEAVQYSLVRQQKFDYVAEEDAIVNITLLGEDEDGNEDAENWRDLLKQTAGKPHYVPDQEEFLRYADDMYFEMTPQLTALKVFVLKHLSNNEELVDSLIDDIQLAISMEQPMQEVIHEFDRRGIVFEDMKQVERIVELLTAIHNTTRRWSNCGHTPNELGALRGNSSGGAAAPVYQLRPSNGETRRSVKIGRNEPCPCGSGVKYKKCCGK